MNISILEIIQKINQNGFSIAIIMLILSCIKLPKYELNIWQLFIKSVNRETNEKLNELYSQFNELKNSFDSHLKEDKEDEMDQKRRNIINFSSEVSRGVPHTEEQYNQILEDIDEYVKFCNETPDYPNTKAEASIEHIRQTYIHHVEKHDFI